MERTGAGTGAEHMPAEAFVEIGLVNPAHVQHGEVKVIFAHPFNRPRRRFLFGAQTGIEVQVILLLEM